MRTILKITINVMACLTNGVNSFKIISNCSGEMSIFSYTFLMWSGKNSSSFNFSHNFLNRLSNTFMSRDFISWTCICLCLICLYNPCLVLYFLLRFLLLEVRKSQIWRYKSFPIMSPSSVKLLSFLNCVFSP